MYEETAREEYLLILNENTIKDIANAFNDALYKKVFYSLHDSRGKVASLEIENENLYLRVSDANDYYVFHYMKIPYGAEFSEPNDGVAISNSKQITTFLVDEKQTVSFLWEENGKDCFLDISLAEGIIYSEAENLVTERRFNLT